MEKNKAKTDKINNNKKFGKYTIGEEIASSIIHGIGAALAISALVILLVYSIKGGDIWRVGAFSIYGTSLILGFLASTLYHSLTNATAKRIFNKLDHSSIYLLIAGSYTPMTLIMRGGWGWSLFGVIWGMAIIGIILKCMFFGRFRWLSVTVYLIMGWLVIIAIKPVTQVFPKEFFYWLLLGGLSYSFGVIFYMMKKVKYTHAIWHLFVMGGSVLHFFGFLFYLTRI